MSPPLTLALVELGNAHELCVEGLVAIHEFEVRLRFYLFGGLR